MSESLRKPRAAVSRSIDYPAVVLLLAALACLALNLPGHLSYDSVVQLSQGRTGVYNAWHPPIMAWLLGMLDAIRPGAALFVLLDVALLFAALAVLARPPRIGQGAQPGSAAPARGPWWPAALLALLWSATPQLLIYPAIVWKDVLFAASSVAGFACLAALARASGPPEAKRRGLLLGAAALVLLTLATLVRQNGVVVLVFGAATFGWTTARTGAPRRRRRGVAAAATFLALGVLAAGAVNAALGSRGDGEPSRRYQLEDLKTYDLVSALVLRPDLPLSVLDAQVPRLEQLLRSQGVAAYTPVRIDPLVELDALTQARDEDAEVIGAQWKDLVLHRPLLYLQVRARAFAWVFLTPQISECVPVYVGVDGPQPLMARLGIAPRSSARDEFLQAYGLAFMDEPLLSHAFYAALAVCILVFVLLRRRGADIAVAGLLLSALAFTGTFLLISVACDYRYLYFLDVAAMGASLHLAASLGPLRWPRSKARRHQPLAGGSSAE